MEAGGAGFPKVSQVIGMRVCIAFQEFNASCTTFLLDFWLVNFLHCFQDTECKMTALTMAQTPSISRYRSFRGKSVSETRRVIESVLDPENSLRSRYRKRAMTITVPDLPRSELDLHAFPLPVATALTVDTAVDTASLRGVLIQTQEQKLLQEIERQRLTEEDEAAIHAAEVARLEAETDRILAEQKRKDIERLHSQLLSHKPRSPLLEKLGFFRGRRSNATLSPTPSSLEPQLMPRTVDGRAFTFPQNYRHRSVQVRCRGGRLDVDVTPNTNAADVLAYADAHMDTVVESYATLGLERRLRRYERVADVLDSWDRDTQHHLFIDSDTFDGHRDLEPSAVPENRPKGFVLQMHHSQRPGRWNKRFITLLENGQIFACKKPDSVVLAQHQVGGSASPALTAAATSAGAMLCHLTGHDIYTPTETQAKKLKPKRFCYALKSQQKLTEAENFVHFFATDDPDVARQFHRMVHGWRSWYIVNGRGPRAGGSRSHPACDDSLALLPIPHPSAHQEMQLQQRPATATGAPQIIPVRHKPRKSISHVKVTGSRHRLRVSIDEAPYTIGEFQPLLDLGRFNKPIDEFGKDWELRASDVDAVAPALPLPSKQDTSWFPSASEHTARTRARSVSEARRPASRHRPPRFLEVPQGVGRDRPQTSDGKPSNRGRSNTMGKPPVPVRKGVRTGVVEQWAKGVEGGRGVNTCGSQ